LDRSGTTDNVVIRPGIVLHDKVVTTDW